MTGLIVKDFLVSKRYMRTIFLLLAFYVLFSFAMGSSSFILFMTPLFFTMMTITSFAYDNAAKWNAYALTMPVTRGDLVFSKYIVSALYALSGCVLALAVSAVVDLVSGRPLTGELGMMVLGALGASLTIISIVLPLIFKFGVEKARMMMVAVFVIPSVLAVVLPQSGIPMPSEELLKSLAILSPFLVVAVFVGSYFLSNRIFSKKDL